MFDPQLPDLVKAHREADLAQATKRHDRQLALQGASLASSTRLQIQRQISALCIWFGHHLYPNPIRPGRTPSICDC